MFIFDDAFDREEWIGFATAVMAFNGLTDGGRSGILCLFYTSVNTPKRHENKRLHEIGKIAGRFPIFTSIIYT